MSNSMETNQTYKLECNNHLALLRERIEAGNIQCDEFIDVVEGLIAEESKIAGHECETSHTFTPGLYGRKFTMPAGTLLTSKIHNSEHQFVVLSGCLSVWTKEDGCVDIVAPHHGVTKPGTRRLIISHTDSVWMTFHATEETNLELIEEKIIMKNNNPYLEGGA